MAEIKIGDVFVRLMPVEMAQAQGVGFDPDKPETFQTLDQYIVWRDAQEEKERTKGIVAARLAALEAGRRGDPILATSRPYPTPRRKSKG